LALSLRIEKKLAREGYKLIAGVDEVGRGPLAGPIVAAAVIFPPGINIPGLNDSKKLSRKQREALYPLIREKAIGCGIAAINNRVIDRINIGRANRLAMKRAVLKMAVRPDYLLIDGPMIRIDLPIEQEGITGGDHKCASIAAASIIAKVTRDRIMVKYHRKYPDYGFDEHKGYGTKKHLQRLMKYGPTSLHRRSFYPVSELAGAA